MTVRIPQLFPRRKDAPALMGLLASYWLAATIGLQWTVIPGARTAIWPASGIALAALLLGGVRLWPAVFLGRLLAALAVGSPQPWWVDAWIALATAAGAVVPVILIRRRDFDPSLGNLTDAARVAVLGGGLGALVSASLAGLALAIAGTTLDRLIEVLKAWSVGFAVGVVVFAPLTLAWWGRRGKGLSPTSWAHLVLCLACTAGAADLIFLHSPGGALRTWHLLPVLIWAALAFSVRGISLALLIVSGFAVASAVAGLGPLSEVQENPASRILFAQQFVAITSVAMLALASAADERRGKASIARSEALRHAILEAALDCIVTITDDDRVVEWNGACERVFGYSRDEAIGRDLTDLIIPPQYIDAHRRGMQHYLATGAGPVLGKRLELEARRSDGSLFPVELAISAIEVDRRPHFTAYLRDLTEQVRARAAASESEQRLRATYEHALAGIAEVAPDGTFLRVNERFCELTGYSRAELLARRFWDISHPDDNATERDRFRRQMQGELEVYTVEKRYLHKRGHLVWVELSASRVVDADAQPLYGVRVVHDISERKRWEQQQLLLINELNHRVKNTLATVQSVVAQTMRSGAPLAELRRAIEGRLVALSQAHDVLTQENWEGAELVTIVERAAAPFADADQGRIRFSGPPVRLSPRHALALSMALHELGTNAAKYGALANAEGWVEISWRISGPAEDRLVLNWREVGGPVVTPPQSKGFGTRLLERGLAQDLGGKVELRFDPDGLQCRMIAPLEAPPGTSGPYSRERKPEELFGNGVR